MCNVHSQLTRPRGASEGNKKVLEIPSTPPLDKPGNRGLGRTKPTMSKGQNLANKAKGCTQQNGSSGIVLMVHKFSCFLLSNKVIIEK